MVQLYSLKLSILNNSVVRIRLHHLCAFLFVCLVVDWRYKLICNSDSDMGNGNLKPSEIRYTRDKIESEFANGRKLTDTFEELLYKRIPTKFIDDIEVVYVDDAW